MPAPRLGPSLAPPLGGEMRRCCQHGGIAIHAREAALAIPDGRREQVAGAIRAKQADERRLAAPHILGSRLAELGGGGFPVQKIVGDLEREAERLAEIFERSTV